MSEEGLTSRERELLEELTRRGESIEARLEVNEKRRTCNWALGKIGKSLARLSSSSTKQNRSLDEMYESLDGYVNMTFKTTDDLHAVGMSLAVILGDLEEFETAKEVTKDDSILTASIREILGDLETLDTGDPPGGVTAAENAIRTWVYPERRDDERKAARERLQERLNARVRRGKSSGPGGRASEHGEG